MRRASARSPKSSCRGDRRRRPDAAVQAFLAGCATIAPTPRPITATGFTRLRRTPPSPAATYPAQLDALDDDARERGRSFADLPLSDRQAVVEAAITAAKIERLPGRPDGGHVATDLMAFFFNSVEANDLCYRAQIGRDTCRGLTDRDERPAPLTVEAADADLSSATSASSAAAFPRHSSPQRVAELPPGTSIIVVEAGDRLFDTKKRLARSRAIAGLWRESVARRLHRGSIGAGVISRTMAVGGSALHWGGVTNRFSRRRSATPFDVWPRRRLADRVDRARALLLRRRAPDWRRRRAGPLPEDRPIGAVPDAGNAAVVESAAAEGVGRARAAFRSGPRRRPRTRCPTTVAATASAATPARSARPARAIRQTRRFRRLLATKAIALHDRTLVRRLVPAADGGKTPRDRRRRRRFIAIGRTKPVEYRARRSWSPPATAGVLTCCCCPRRAGSPTGSRTVRASSAGT